MGTTVKMLKSLMQLISFYENEISNSPEIEEEEPTKFYFFKVTILGNESRILLYRGK